MKIKIIVCVCVCVVLGISGCGVKNDKNLEFFTEKIHQLLEKDDQVLIIAAELTNFQWNKLCFERKKFVTLNFFTEDEIITFKLNYRDYFIEEPYVENSVAGKCVTNNDELLITKRYAGSSIPNILFETKK